MAEVRIFLSFEFDKDKQLYCNFYAQAQENSSYRVKNHSLRQDYPTEEWLDKAKKNIRQCDIVIVLVGQDTHNAARCGKRGASSKPTTQTHIPD